jgi:uncharacterized protein (DUF427 family)
MDTDIQQADRPAHVPLRIEDGPKRVRTYLGGELIADTRHPKLVWEIPYYPAYYFPRDDVRMKLLTPNGHTHHSASRGTAHKFTVTSTSCRARVMSKSR